MSDPALRSNRTPARGSLGLMWTTLIVAGAAAGVWFGMRSEPPLKAEAPQGVKPMSAEIVSATPEPQAAVEENRSKTLVPKASAGATAKAAVPSEAQLRARMDTAIAIAQNSPTEALRWAKSLPESERAPAVVAAANETARTKPSEALAALVELEPSFERDAALAHAASQWATIDAKGASAWAAEGAPGELREEICSAVAIAMAEGDPKAAAEFLATQMADGLSVKTAAVAVVQRWAQKDAKAAKAWAEQFPPGPIREDALREIEVQVKASAGAE